MSSAQPVGTLAVPASGDGRPVLVLHAWWGLNATLKAFCERLAQAGFTAFAPDLYHGQIADTIPAAETLSKALDYRQARSEVAEAARFIGERTGATGCDLAVIGFSLGAFYALDLAAAHPEQIRSVVLFYGTGEGDFSTSQAAFLGHFAADDPYESKEGVDGLEAALQRAGRPVTFYRYAGTGHWFFESDRVQAYRPAAASLAWARTLAFLNRPVEA